MLIDWFTVAAQAVNFLILVWLLKRFLYRPVLDAIDARESRIAAALAAAEEQRSEAEKEREALRKQNEAFEQQREALLDKAAIDAGQERQRLLDEAGRAADELAARRRQALILDARSMDQAIGQRAREEVFAITRKALADLAATELEERMVDVMIRRLDELRPGEKRTGNTSPVLVRSAFELPRAQAARLEQAIGKQLGSAARVRFETAPELVSGIELVTDGRKIAWSIADYLDSLQESVNELLQEQPESGVENERQKG